MTQVQSPPDLHQEAIIRAYDIGGAPSVISFIGSFRTLDERKSLYRLAQRTMSRAELPDLDALTAVANAGIADLLSAAEEERAAGNGATADGHTDSANALSYNLSADLAECWPGDKTPREMRHFEAGLAAALDCIRWRAQLNKGAWSFSIAWWARGTHELSLGRAGEAVQSYREALRYAAAATAEKEGANDPDSDFGCLLAKGYLGLAQTAVGDADGKELLDYALARFVALVPAGGEIGEDANFGINQIETMRQKLAARGIVEWS